jgi:hypothetical protein
VELIKLANYPETYDRELDAKHAAARGLVDALLTPENVRYALTLALWTCLNTSQPTSGCLYCLNDFDMTKIFVLERKLPFNPRMTIIFR